MHRWAYKREISHPPLLVAPVSRPASFLQNFFFVFTYCISWPGIIKYLRLGYINDSSLFSHSPGIQVLAA